jgi:hypothetical protein
VFTLNPYRCCMMNLPSATRDENALGPRPDALDPSRCDLEEAARWRRKCVQKEAGAAKRLGSELFRFGTLVTY